MPMYRGYWLRAEAVKGGVLCYVYRSRRGRLLGIRRKVSEAMALVDDLDRQLGLF